MDPITTALVAGATFVLKGVASEAVKDAYKGLKDLLAGKLSSLTNLEEDPADEDYRKAAEKELQKKGVAQDPAVLGKANELSQAIEREPKDRLAAAGIDISGLRAARDVIVKRLSATGGVHLQDIRAEQGTIDIQDISAGTSGKN
jgi:hypothetical protein